MRQKSVLEDPKIKAAIEARKVKQYPRHTAVDEVCPSEIRRYVQATMNDSPLWYDEAFAKSTRFGLGCAPATMTLRMVGGYKKALGTSDPIRNKGNIDYRTDTEETDRIPWEEVGMGVYHGGDDVEYLQLPKVGDRISSQGRPGQYIEKTGRSGKLVVTISETVFTNQRGEVLCINHGNGIVKQMEGDAWKPLRKR